MRLNFVRYADMVRLIGASGMSADIKCVVGVPRSGMIPASMLAIKMNVPLGMVGSPVAGGGFRLAKKGDLGPGDLILLVDDSLLTGKSMAAARASLVEQGVPDECIRTMAVFVAPDKRDAVDFHAAVVASPRIFEWNLWNTHLSWNVMLDMDGVLCFDPEPFDDDGPEYGQAIREAVPRFLPEHRVHSIVTNRIERWRGVTEDWLADHGVEYGSLVMQPFDTAAERRKHSDPASFKASHYSESDAWLYVESHNRIAKRIAELARKQVFSVESGLVFRGEN